MFCFHLGNLASPLSVSHGPGGGPLRNIVVHMQKQTKKKGKGGLFQSRMHKTGSMFRGLKCPFFRKKVGFVKIYSNSTDLDLLRGSNLRQNPTKSLFRGEFCILT